MGEEEPHHGAARRPRAVKTSKRTTATATATLLRFPVSVRRDGTLPGTVELSPPESGIRGAGVGLCDAPTPSGAGWAFLLCVFFIVLPEQTEWGSRGSGPVTETHTPGSLDPPGEADNGLEPEPESAAAVGALAHGEMI